MHLQFNDNCTPTSAVLVWSAVSSGGTTNVPPAITSFDTAYTDVAFTSPLPGAGPNWVVDPACALRCGLNATAINGVAPQSISSLLKTKLAQKPSRIFSAEQVAAADATALFGQGVKQTVQDEAVLAAQALAAKANRTIAGKRK
jgi:hypothetical protein